MLQTRCWLRTLACYKLDAGDFESTRDYKGDQLFVKNFNRPRYPGGFPDFELFYGVFHSVIVGQYSNELPKMRGITTCFTVREIYTARAIGLSRLRTGHWSV